MRVSDCGIEDCASAGDFVELQRAAKCTPNGFDNCGRRRFIQRNAERVVANNAEIDFFTHAARDDFVLLVTDSNRDRVEKCFVLNRETKLAQTCRQHRGFAMQLAAQCASSLRGRDRPRTSKPSLPTTPARCKYSTSPFRGEYVVRAFATPGDRPELCAHPPKRQPIVRASHVCTHLSRTYTPRAGRHNPSARRSVARNRWRCLHRVRRARRATSDANKSAAMTAMPQLACTF